MSDVDEEKRIELREQAKLRRGVPGAYKVRLSESLLRLKGHIIDDVKLHEDEEGLHVEINSTERNKLEPENDMAVSYSHISFLIPVNLAA